MLTTLPLISSILALLLGFLVWSRNRKSKVNNIFALICLSFVVWFFGTYQMFSALTKANIIFWDRFVYLGVIFIPTLMYHFAAVFTDSEEKHKKSIILSYILSAFFLVANGTKYFIDDVYYYPYAVHSQARFFHHFFLIFFAIYLISFFAILYRSYKVCPSAVKRNQIKYIFTAFFILAFASVEYLPAYGISVYPVFYLLGVVFVFIVAYAIVAHRLMDIKLVLRRSFVYLASLITILLFVILVKYLSISFFGGYDDVFNFGLLILAILFFPFLKNYYYRLANKYFFSSLYDSQKVVADLSDKLRMSLSVEKICEVISRSLVNSFHARAAGILRRENKTGDYLVLYNHGFPIGHQKKFPGNLLLHNIFVKKNQSIVAEEIVALASKHKATRQTLGLLNKFKAEILTPLNVEEKNIGLIVLAAKESGDMYNNEDMRVLAVIGAQAAIALQNAFLYEESLKFGEKLKKEVAKATQDLREANIHLRQLDKAKTEFISITSHQLRTPLSGIKGYLSMLLDGDFGSLENEQRKVLTDVYKNTERLVRLVNIFLNISRIESGHLKLERTKFDLVKLIEESKNQLQTDADKKHLKLKFIKPAESFEISADRDKLQDVILNLIDNAIKYTTKGEVALIMENLADKVRISVKDTGIGIAAGEVKELFTKFVRGKNIPQIETTGSGLGLFIAKKIIELHGGKIWAESEGQGKGSEFRFEIPV